MRVHFQEFFPNKETSQWEKIQKQVMKTLLHEMLWIKKKNSAETSYREAQQSSQGMGRVT